MQIHVVWLVASLLGSAVLVSQILQIALAGQITDGAIQRVIDQEEFDNAFAGFENFRRCQVLNDHSVGNGRAA